MTNTILVTGAGGFIGSAVLAQLRDADIKVRAFDLGPAPSELPPNAQWIQGSMNCATDMRRALMDVDAVIHLAFVMDIEAEHPLISCETNLLSTVRLFDLAREYKVRRVVWASSVMVYGPLGQYPAGPISEAAEPMPRTSYGASKLALEWFARSYRARGLETIGLRFTTVFGPSRKRLGAAGFCVTLFEDAIRGEIYIKEADRRANMLFVDDAASACIKCLHATGPLSDVYNISGFDCSVGDLVKIIQACHVVPEVYTEPGGSSPWPTDICYDHAQQDIDYQPRYDIKRSCQTYLQYLQATDLPGNNIKQP